MTPPTQTAMRPEVSGTIARIMAGEVFSCLLLDDKDQRAAALETIIDQFSTDGTRFAWVGNPLRSPLTIERFLMQIAGPEIDLRVERGPAELAQIIAQPVGDESRLLIIVQQPETLSAEARELLGASVEHLAGSPVQVQFLFAGPGSFRPPPIATPKPMSFALTVPVEEAPALSTVRRRDVLPLLVLLLAVIVGVMISMVPPAKDGMPQAAVSPAPPPTETVTGTSGLPPAEMATETRRPQLPSTETAALRQEFDAFLAQRASSLPPLSDSQKDSLFTEFLTHHRRE